MFQRTIILLLACALIVQHTAECAGNSLPDGVKSQNNTTPCGNNTSCLQTPFAAALIVGMVVTLGVAVFGAIGNTLTILTIVHQFCMPPRYRHIPGLTSTVVLIMNLALADLLYCLLSLPVMFVIYLHIYISDGVSHTTLNILTCTTCTSMN